MQFLIEGKQFLQTVNSLRKVHVARGVQSLLRVDGPLQVSLRTPAINGMAEVRIPAYVEGKSGETAWVSLGRLSKRLSDLKPKAGEMIDITLQDGTLEIIAPGRKVSDPDVAYPLNVGGTWSETDWLNYEMAHTRNSWVEILHCPVGFPQAFSLVSYAAMDVLWDDRLNKVLIDWSDDLEGRIEMVASNGYHMAYVTLPAHIIEPNALPIGLYPEVEGLFLLFKEGKVSISRSVGDPPRPLKLETQAFTLWFRNWPSFASNWRGALFGAIANPHGIENVDIDVSVAAFLKALPRSLRSAPSVVLSARMGQFVIKWKGDTEKENSVEDAMVSEGSAHAEFNTKYIRSTVQRLKRVWGPKTRLKVRLRHVEPPLHMTTSKDEIEWDYVLMPIVPTNR